MKKILAILILLFFISALNINAQGNNLTAQQKEWLKAANRHDKNGWIYLHIEGSAPERGFQHGYLLAKDIKETLRILKYKWEYQTAVSWDLYVNKGSELFEGKIDGEDLAEIDGIVTGMAAAGITTSRNEIIALNGYMELMWYWWPTVKDQFSSNSPEPRKESCSSFIATGSMTADGKIVLAHNSMTDYTDSFCNVILDILPEKGHRILMQSYTGFIHSGTDFFITDAGLVGSETTIGDFIAFDPKGVPEFSRMRHATQYANNIDEWCDMMKKDNNGGYANSWLLGDINTNEIARLELGLKHIGFEKKKDGYFTGSNIAEDVKLLRLETKSDDTNIKYSKIARRVRWHNLLNKYAGKVTLNLAEQFEADHFDTYLNLNKPSDRTLCAHMDLDPQYYTSGSPFYPGGTVDGKAVDAKMAKNMSLAARFGSACGTPFIVKKYLEKNPQFGWLAPILRDRPSQPWTIFKAGELK